jgi:hypothetical protein
VYDAIRLIHATRGFITLWDFISDEEAEAIRKHFWPPASR